MYYERTYLALKTLFTKAPNEFSAMAAESRLFEEAGDKLMPLHFVNILLLERPFSASHQLIELIVINIFTHFQIQLPNKTLRSIQQSLPESISPILDYQL